MTDWQPIETAPKDGTPVLLLCPVSDAESDDLAVSVGAWDDQTRGPGASGYTQAPGWCAMADGYWVDDSGWDTGYGFSRELEPIRWMPIPSFSDVQTSPGRPE